MKYGTENLAYIALGPTTPIQVDGVLKGYGVLINGTIFEKGILLGFEDGQVCNCDSVQDGFDWMNEISANFSSRKFHKTGEG